MTALYRHEQRFNLTQEEAEKKERFGWLIFADPHNPFHFTALKLRPTPVYEGQQSWGGPTVSNWKRTPHENP